MNILAKIEFDLLEGTFTFTDIIGDSHASVDNGSIEYIKGIVKVTGPYGVLYKNRGWDDEDFSSPDTEYKKWVNTDLGLFTCTEDNSLPIGEYIIEYKMTTKSTGIVEGSVSEKFINEYARPVGSVSLVADYEQNKLVLSDTTNYTVNGKDPSNDLTTKREMRMTWAEGSGGLGVSTNQESLDIDLGATIVAGTNKAFLDTFPEYTFSTESGNKISVVLKDTYLAYQSLKITNTNQEINVFKCLVRMIGFYESEADKKSIKADYLRQRALLLSKYFKMYTMAISTGQDKSFFMQQIIELVDGCECSYTDYIGFGENDESLVRNVHAYLQIVLKEYSAQLNFNNLTAQRTSSHIEEIGLWYRVYTMAATEDKVVPGNKLISLIGGYEVDEYDLPTDPIDYSNCKQTMLNCLTPLSIRFEDYKATKSNASETTLSQINIIMAYYQLFEMAVLVDGDKSIPCDILKELLYACDCNSFSLEESDNPYILWGNVSDIDNVTLADIEALAGKEQRANRFGNIYNIAQEGNYLTIVFPVSFDSLGKFTYSGTPYQFVDRGIFSYTDELGNTYDVQAWVWPVQSYGVWTEVKPL